MERPPNRDELVTLGFYDPNAPGAPDRLRMLTRAFELGGTLDEVAQALEGRDKLLPLLLDLITRPPGETRDLADFALSSPHPELVQRIWSALGLPDSEFGSVRVTPDAAEALRVLTRMAALLGEEATLGVARVLGSSMARLAEAISDALRVSIEVPRLNAGRSYAQVAEDLISTARDSLPSFLESVAAVFRRHLINVAYQTWSTDSEHAAVTLERTVCFADLVGSTEAIQALSVREMATMLRHFEEHVWAVVSANGGRVVKLIGDEAMFVLDDPARSCQAGLDLIELCERPVRVGMAHGTVISLFGDYYGETVNLAARLVNLADPSTLLVSESVRAKTGPDRTGRGITFEVLPHSALKGFAHPVPVFRADRLKAGSQE